jgi:hypothetical protein
MEDQPQLILGRVCRGEIFFNRESHCNACLQLIHDPRAGLHHAMPVPQQLPQIAILPVRHPDLREAILQQQLQNQSCILPTVFCLRTRWARISAASPIHNSNCSSLNTPSNQRACPLASIPTRTFLPARAR